MSHDDDLGPGHFTKTDRIVLNDLSRTAHDAVARLIRVESLLKAHQGGGFRWKVGRPAPKERAMPLDLSCTNEEKIPVTVTPVTATGKPSAIEAGSLSISVTSGDATANKIDDTNFELVSGTNPGDSTFLVQGDADLGAGVQTISDTITLHVSNPLATSLGLSAGAPVAK